MSGVWPYVSAIQQKMLHSVAVHLLPLQEGVNHREAATHVATDCAQPPPLGPVVLDKPRCTLLQRPTSAQQDRGPTLHRRPLAVYLKREGAFRLVRQRHLFGNVKNARSPRLACRPGCHTAGQMLWYMPRSTYSKSPSSL